MLVRPGDLARAEAFGKGLDVGQEGLDRRHVETAVRLESVRPLGEHGRHPPDALGVPAFLPCQRSPELRPGRRRLVAEAVESRQGEFEALLRLQHFQCACELISLHESVLAGAS